MRGWQLGGCVRRQWILQLAMGGTFGLLLSLAGCNQQRPQQAEAPTPEFTVAHPIVMENSIDFDEYTGRTDAIQSVEVRARVTGYLDKIHFVDSEVVQQGTLLFTIDPRPYVAERNRAEGEVTRLKSRRDRLQIDVDRVTSLVKTNAASRQEYDKALGDRAEVEGELLAAQAALDKAVLDLGFTEVKAPITGRISRRLITEGNLVSAGGLGGAGTLLTTIVSQDPIYVYCDCSEANMLKYQALSSEGSRKSGRDFGIPIYIGLAHETGYPREGKIDFIDNKVDASTGTILARGIFSNSDEFLKPGMFVRVRVPGTAVYSAILVPERAIGTQQGEKFLFVVGKNEEGKEVVEHRKVKLGALKDAYRVIESGVKAEDQIVIAAMARVRPGMVLKPKLIELPKPESIENEKKAIEQMNAAEPQPTARSKAAAERSVAGSAERKQESAPVSTEAPKP